MNRSCCIYIDPILGLPKVFPGENKNNRNNERGLMKKDQTPSREDQIPSPLDSIKKFCLWCKGDGYVDLCHTNDCALWPYRLGRQATAEDKSRWEALGLYKKRNNDD